MSLGQWFQILALIFGILAAVFGFLGGNLSDKTYLQTLKQIAGTRHPHLLIDNSVYRYELRWIPLEDLSVIIRPELLEGQKNQYDSRLPVFRIKNIGDIPAESIMCTWRISGVPIKEVIQLSPILQKYHPTIDNGFIFLSLVRKGGSNSFGVPLGDEESTNSLYYIASPSSNHTDPLQMPNKIADNYVLRLIAKPRPNRMSFFNGPEVHVDISYNDADKKQYKRSFAIESSISFTPDNVQSTLNSLDPRFRNSDNMRASITFSVKPI